MTRRDIVVVGASAGGVEALLALVAGLPPDLPAAVFVVLHIPATSRSLLPRLLSNAGPLPAAHAANGDAITPGRILIAPPDRHLLLARDHVHVVRGPRENNHRPAVDPLFRSAAATAGPRVIGVVLSGALDDGAAGLVAIHQCGGIGVVQDPDESLFDGMPRSAIAADTPVIAPIAAMPALIVRLVTEEVSPMPAPPAPDDMDYDNDIAQFDLDAVEDDGRPGVPSPFACPECGGVLWERDGGGMIHYRCRVGHAYSPDTLLAQQSEHLEAALWAALRGLEEKVSLSERLAARAREQRRPTSAERFIEQARESETHARLIRQVLLTGSQRIEGGV